MVQLFVCGDVSNHTHSEDFIDDSLGTIINEADYAVCNFEGPELAPNRSENYPHQGAGTAAYLSRMGFDLMLLANNHITEQGAEGIEYSIDKIQCAGSDYIGAGLTWEQAYRTLQKTIKGVKFGFINICEAQVGQFLSREQAYGYAWMGYDGLFDNIHKLSEDNDIVIIFVHAGLEHFDLPLPEIRDFYFKLCEAGASIVIGGHTHTAQGFEFHNESLIVYSLGNFFFPYPDGIRTQENTSYSVKINIDDQMHIAVSVIHHTTRDGRVFLLQDTSQQIDVNYLNGLLGSSYLSKANTMCRTAYKNLCSRLLAEATCGEYENMGLAQRLKKEIKLLLFRKKYVFNNSLYRNELLLRLFENETYRWTIVRALKEITKRTK